MVLSLPVARSQQFPRQLVDSLSQLTSRWFQLPTLTYLAANAVHFRMENNQITDVKSKRRQSRWGRFNLLKLCALIQYTLASQIMSRLPFLTMTCRGRDDNRLRYTLKKQKAIVNCKASIWASPDLISQERDDSFNPSTRPSWCFRLKSTARNTTGHLVRYMDAPFTYSR